MQADYVLNYDVLSVAQEHRLYVMARIKAKPAPDAEKRPPLNLSVVLDRSGSMAGSRLEHAKKAIEFLIQHLTPRDRFSLVTYDKTVSVDISPTSISHKDPIIQALNKIRAGSTTNLSGGWLQGCHQVSTSETMVGQINRVLLLSDGLANEGITDPTRLAAMTKQKRAESITTSTMGVGLGFNEDLLSSMAAEGGGAFYFIDDPEQAPAIFAEELRGLLTVVAQNLTITLKPSIQINAIRQLNMYSTEVRNGYNTYLLGDLFGDEVKTLVFEFDIPAIRSLGVIEVAKLTFDFDEIADTSVNHQTLELPIVVNGVAADEFQSATENPEVVKQVLLLQASHVRKEAMAHADKGEFATASAKLNEFADDLMSSHLMDDELQTEHDILREEAINLSFGPEGYDTHMRKTMSSNLAYSTTRLWTAGKIATGNRLRRSRPAKERYDSTPTVLMWGNEELLLAFDRITIGRHSGNDIVIDEEEVSETHCFIMRDGDSLYLEDNNSTNGTFANGGQLTGRFRLSVGDVITIGSRMFMAR